jgi:hypothetical protein
MMVLVIVLALVNVSATVLMAGSWASLTNGMLDLEKSIQDRLTETVNWAANFREALFMELNTGTLGPVWL